MRVYQIQKGGGKKPHLVRKEPCDESSTVYGGANRHCGGKGNYPHQGSRMGRRISKKLVKKKNSVKGTKKTLRRTGAKEKPKKGRASHGPGEAPQQEKRTPEEKG